jgi:PPK2 family polyphosphate:nucleotide phosphotransferase
MAQPIRITSKIRLKDFKTTYTAGMSKEEAREETTKLCFRIAELQQLLYANSDRAVILLLQGMDTSGKDGAGKRVLEFVPPSGVETSNFKVPSSEERAHDFLWRAHKAVPRYGHIGVFNRSHYEDVLVVRVMDLVPKSVWKARYDQINGFEQILSDNNYIILKFFLHISKEEQAERLQARIDDPTKNWKFEESDLEMRKRWDDFQEAYEDVVNNCSTKYAPWHIIPADHKWFRDFAIAEAVADALQKLHMKWPKPKMKLSKIKIK